MADLRESPYIWVTWLAKVMSGDTTCQWQSWFQSQNKLTEKQPSDFDSVGWKIDHTKMLTELKERLIKEKYKPIIEQPIKYKIPDSDITLAGKPDCVIEKEDEIIVCDCKTGKERDSDQAQVMIYMYLLSKDEFYGKQSKGIVIYKDKKMEIPNLPKSFAENFDFFVNILSSSKPPAKNPGSECKFCSITKKDCSERID